MARIFALGAAPLPHENLLRQYAANLRTWHFVKPLLEDGHEIRLVGCRLPNTYPDDAPAKIRSVDGRLEYISIPGDRFHDTVLIQRLFDEHDYDAVVGVHNYMASRAAHIETDKPMWLDLNGWVMAEAQTKTYVYDDDDYLAHFWRMERAVLDRADVISVVSEAQVYATIGELAARGRLGRKNFGYEFVHRIPNAISGVKYEHSSQVIRGVLVDEDAFVVLWAGGYNTWTDVDLLFTSLTAAMAELPEMHFVSTGGVIEGHDEITFTRFRERIDECPYADRFHFVGWVPTADVPSYYFESDLGLSVDSANYETTFGARNRLNDMLKVGLPILTTLGTEISHIVADEEIGLVAPIGDTKAFTERLVWAGRHRDALRQMADAGRSYAREHFSYERTTEPLRRWAAGPWRAPDGGQAVPLEGGVDFFGGSESSEADERCQELEQRCNELERNYHDLEEHYHKVEQHRQELEEHFRTLQGHSHDLEQQLSQIRGSRVWRLWMRYLGIRRFILAPFGKQ